MSSNAPVTMAPAKMNQRSEKTKDLPLARARTSFLPTFLQAPRRRKMGDPLPKKKAKPATEMFTKTGRPKRKATPKQLAAIAKMKQARANVYVPKR